MKKTVLFSLMATAIVGAVIARNSIQSFSSSVVNGEKAELSTNLSSPLAATAKAEEDTIAAAIVTRSDVDLTITNDETYPWIIVDNTIKNGNCGVKYSSSYLTLNYKSECKTELSFDWLSRNYSNHPGVKLYVDGVERGSKYYDNNYSNCRLMIDAGEHIIVIKDSIGNSTSTYNYSHIKNLNIKEMSPLESTVLTEKSLPLTFSNDGEWPWTIEDGYIQNSNYGTKYSSSSFSTTFTIDKTSKFCYEIAIPNYDTYWNGNEYISCHDLYVNINGRRWDYWRAKRDWTLDRIVLEPGTYTIEFLDTIRNTTGQYFARLRNLSLTNNWVDVELASAGTLGVEVLYKVDILNDVEMLKVKGPINSTDWTTIKQMVNLSAIDLSEATFESLPNNAFDGMTWLGSIILPEGLKTIGSYAFKGTRIININIPSTVKTIGFAAFEGLNHLCKVSFSPNSRLQEIGKYAFKACPKLKEIVLPNALEKINYAAFDQCYAIENIVMPNTVTFVGAYAFQGCTSMKYITFSDALTEIKEWVCNDCYSLTDVHLPINLSRINYESFRDNTSLRHVEIPSTVNTIVRRAFYNCGLDSIKLPIRLQNLGTEAFSYCNNLKYIEFPSYLERRTYSYCDSYGNDGDRQYWYDDNSGYRSNFTYCPNIETIVMRAAAPPVNDADAFANSRAKSAITLKVPSFAVVNYKLDTYWYQFGSIIEGDDVDYWRIASSLSLANNRRMDGSPDIDLFDGGKLTIGGSAPFEARMFNFFPYQPNPCSLLTDCPNIKADTVNTYYGVDANKWYFFTPLYDVDLSKVEVSNNVSYVFRYYDGESRALNGPGNSWRNVTDNVLKAGHGYIFQCNNWSVVTFPADSTVHEQVFTISDVTVPLSSYDATNSANKGWNYIGNPYPSFYDIYYMDFTAPITVWTGSTYKAYSIVDDNYVLLPMQAFFVQKPDEIDNIVFHKEGRQHTTSISRASYAPQRANSTGNANRFLFDIQISNEEDMIDETRVVINDKALCAYEIEKDASKFMSMENGVPQIFTLDKEGNFYAINERPAEDGNVALGYSAAQSGFYTISIVKAAGEILLYDKKMDKTIDLTTQDYTFYSDATQGVDNTRFTLIFGNLTPTGISSTENASTSVVASSGCITINGAEGQNVMVFTADGRSVFSGTLKNDALRVDVANGAYIVKVGNSAVKTLVSSK